MNRMIIRVITLLALLGAFPLSGRARTLDPWLGPEPPLLSLHAGISEVFDSHQEWTWAVAYRPAYRLYHIGPYVLFSGGHRGEFYASAGLLMDLRLGERWVFTPGGGVGYYDDNGGLFLGHEVQFTMFLELARRFPNEHRLGLNLGHLSNGHIGRFNPGTETLTVAWSIPLNRRPFRRP